MVEVRRRKPVEPPPNELEAFSSQLATIVLERLEEALGSNFESASVSVNLSDGPPYLVEVEVEVRTKYPYKGLGDLVRSVLDEALSKVEALWRGLRDQREARQETRDAQA